jgi:alpha-L-fucosidase
MDKDTVIIDPRDRTGARKGVIVTATIGAALGVGAASAPAPAQTTAPAAPPSGVTTQPSAPLPDTPERHARIAWWRDAKFGMFIHWGLYAVPAGEWKGTKVPRLGEWIMKNANPPIPVKEYEALGQQFNPTEFDADAWAQLAQDAGMKYLVITSKHHDGFAMFKSEVSPYNVVDATPFKRDVVKELAAACAKRGIKFGLYYSQAQDWHEPGGIGNTWDFGPDEEKDKNGAYDKYLREKAEPQVKEILTNYGPICLIWFDTPRLMTAERAARLEKIVHELQPACLVSGRIGPGSHRDYDSEGDNHVPGTVRQGDWETPATLNDTWGFKTDDHNWKTPGDLIFKLVDIVSKGGNYLLNVGPTAQGVIPPESVSLLRAMGDWMKVNHEAIYGAGSTPWGAEHGKPTDRRDNRNRVIWDVYKEWRCTTKPGKLFITVFKWPADGTMELPKVEKKIKQAYLLADAGKSPLKVTQNDSGTTIAVPGEQPNPLGTVIVLETE